MLVSGMLYEHRNKDWYFVWCCKLPPARQFHILGIALVSEGEKF